MPPMAAAEKVYIKKFRKQCLFSKRKSLYTEFPPAIQAQIMNPSPRSNISMSSSVCEHTLSGSSTICPWEMMRLLSLCLLLNSAQASMKKYVITVLQNRCLLLTSRMTLNM